LEVPVLQDVQIAKMRNEGLVVEGPYQKGTRGWLARFTIAMGPWQEAYGINFLSPPIIWIYEEEGFWFAQKREGVPDPLDTDFQWKFRTTDEAVDAVINFYRSIFPKGR
jgi:hypothetical protein